MCVFFLNFLQNSGLLTLKLLMVFHEFLQKNHEKSLYGEAEAKIKKGYGKLKVLCRGFCLGGWRLSFLLHRFDIAR